RRERRSGCQGPRVLPRQSLRRARGPRSRRAGRPGALRVKVHALVEDLAGAARAVRAGATVVQLRCKGATTDQLVDWRRGFRSLDATFVVNDDVDAAIALRADGVHLGQGDAGAEKARAAGLLLGRSVATPEQATAADADYLGAGPVWESPSKTD